MNAQGFYSLIQYSEFPERAEFVNVGIVLFSEHEPRVLVRFSDNDRRVQRVFGTNQSQHLRLLKESFEKRLFSDFHKQIDREALERFVAMRAGKMRLSAPKSVSVSEPNYTVTDLFEKLVGEPLLRKRLPAAHLKLRRQFKERGVEELLDRPEPVILPQGIVVKAPYGYQNGSYNLIKAISLRDNPEHALEAAGRHGIEGKWLSDATRGKHQKKLVIVGDVSGQEKRFVDAVAEVMRERNVTFYAMEDIDLLVADVEKNYRHDSRFGTSRMS